MVSHSLPHAYPGGRTCGNEIDDNTRANTCGFQLAVFGIMSHVCPRASSSDNHENCRSSQLRECVPWRAEMWARHQW
eukprot:9485284-Pyramimonas_sp.AAC.1